MIDQNRIYGSIFEVEMNAKFEIGKLLITPGALQKIAPEKVQETIGRHVSGDWGEVCEDDSALNDWAMKNHERILSAYRSNEGDRFWVITEADRSVTTILLPSEY